MINVKTKVLKYVSWPRGISWDAGERMSEIMRTGGRSFIVTIIRLQLMYDLYFTLDNI